MRQFEAMIKNLSSRIEFCVVVVAAFGWFVLGSVAYIGARTSGPMITERHLIGVLAYEIIVLLVLTSFLATRGWTPARVGLVPSWRSSAVGLSVAALAYVAYLIAWAGASYIFPNSVEPAESASLVASGIGLGTILAVSILNPLFEELFLCGYLITVLKEARGFWFAVNISAGVRLVYHLYQGPLGVISILPLGLVFGYWYARTKQLWPLVVAHAAFDLVALLWYAAA